MEWHPSTENTFQEATRKINKSIEWSIHKTNNMATLSERKKIGEELLPNGCVVRGEMFQYACTHAMTFERQPGTVLLHFREARKTKHTIVIDHRWWWCGQLAWTDWRLWTANGAGGDVNIECWDVHHDHLHELLLFNRPAGISALKKKSLWMDGEFHRNQIEKFKLKFY